MAAACRISCAERGSSGCISRERALEELESAREILVGDSERGQQADDVAVQAAAEQQQALLAGCDRSGLDKRRRRRLSVAMADELERAHRAEAAGVANGGDAGRD